MPRPAAVRQAIAIAVLAVVGGCRTGRAYPASGPRYAGAPARAAGAHDGTARADTLRVVSFNVEFARHVEGAIDLLRADPALRDADVLLLQEMDAEGARRIAAALDMWHVYYPAIHHRRTRRDFGNAVLSRWPIGDDAKLVLPRPSRYARTHRIATAATIHVGDLPVRVYSTHLGTPLDVGGAGRREQLRAILADAARWERAIVGGDLNDAGVGKLAVDAGFAWPTREGPRTTRFGRWDHIFTRGLRAPAGEAAGTGPDTRGVSDHRPVWAVLVLR